jgi:hypothetical protein
MNANWPGNVPFLYFIVFSKGYNSYSIYDAKLKGVVKAQTLFNN